VDAIVDSVESEGAYRGSPSVHLETSYIGGISDTESGEDEDLALQSHRSVGDNKPTTGADGVDNRSSFVRREREGSVASSIDTF